MSLGGNLRLRASKMLIGIFSISGVAVAQMVNAPASTLSPTSQQKSLPSSFALPSMTFPMATHGYLLSHARIVRQGEKGNIQLTNLKTGVQHSVTFSVAGAPVLRLEGGSVTSEGGVLLGGTYLRSGQKQDIGNFMVDFMTYVAAAPANVVNFVARLDATGQVVSKFEVGGFTPERVCSADDGTIWALGQELAQEVAAAKGPVPEYFLLRHYDPAGNLLGSFLPRNAVAPRNFSPTYQAGLATSSAAFLVCGEASVAAYVARAPRGFVWLEIDTVSGNVEHHLVRSPDGMLITGLVLTQKGSAYASFRSESGNPTGSGSGVYRLSADSRPAVWKPVQQTDPAQNVDMLIGRDGRQLLYVRLSSGGSPLSSGASVPGGLTRDRPAARQVNMLYDPRGYEPTVYWAGAK